MVNPHTSATDRNTDINATKLCAMGIDSYIRWRADAMDNLNAAIDANQTDALPRLVKSWMLLGSRDASFNHIIDGQIETIQKGSVHPGKLHNREHQLFHALKVSRAGNGIEAATILEQRLIREPIDILTQQLIQNELFWMGRSDWMRDVTERSASAWTEVTYGYGPFLSLRAFANEEAGDIEAAERYGRMAVEIDPSDSWGAHAVAHALLMKGEMHTGIEWLERLSEHWGHANQLRHHLWWHVCLFLLELGQHERILALLNSEIRNPQSELVKASPAAGIDIQNFASLLMRLELYGVNVGEQWQTLADICAARVNNHGNAFCNIHDMMVLCATAQHKQARDMLDSMRDQYLTQDGSVALAYKAAGIPACEAIVAHRSKNYQLVLNLLGGVRHDLPLLGASHAQRDVLYHLLVHAAEQEGREDLRQVFLRDIERIGFCNVPSRAAYKNNL